MRLLRAGNVYADGNNSGYINNAGSNGYYWSSVVRDNNNAYNLWFNTGAGNVNPSNTENRYHGLTIRCVAFQS